MNQHLLSSIESPVIYFLSVLSQAINEVFSSDVDNLLTPVFREYLRPRDI